MVESEWDESDCSSAELCAGVFVVDAFEYWFSFAVYDVYSAGFRAGLSCVDAVGVPDDVSDFVSYCAVEDDCVVCCGVADDDWSAPCFFRVVESVVQCWVDVVEAVTTAVVDDDLALEPLRCFDVNCALF